MRRSVRTGWAIIAIVVLALAACGGTAGTSAPSKKATPTATTPATATPTPPPSPSTVYVGVGSSVYALDAHTGSMRWKYDTGQPTNYGNIQSIFVGAGTVFFNDNTGNSLYALDAATGAFRWKVTVFGSVTSMTVVQGVVYATSNDAQAPAVRYAINLQSGAVLWQNSGGGAMVVDADAAYFANTQFNPDGQPTMNGSVRAYNRLTGSQLWQVTGHPFAGLQVGGGVVYTTADNTLYAYNVRSGAALWATQLGSSVGLDQLIGNTLYFRDTAGALALDVTTHKVLWRFAVFNGYMAIGDNMICLANQGHLYGLNATTGAQMWSLQSANGYASVAYDSGTCYANTYSNDRAPLYAVDAATGKLRWSRDIKYIYNGLQPATGAIYAISQASAQSNASLVTALSSADGSTLWTFAPPSQFPGYFVLG